MAETEMAILKVLLILPYAPAAFMQTDLDLLRRHFDLDVVVHTRGKRQLLLSVLRCLRRNRPDVLLLWFIVPSYALALTLLGKLCGVKVVFITGGFDVASIPAIGFGAMRYPLFRLLLKPTLRLADLTLPFSRSAAQQVADYAHPRRCAVIYPGIDTAFFALAPATGRSPLALTVSPVTQAAILQKGLWTFVEAARFAPDVRFALVGVSPDNSLAALRQIAPANVEFIERFLPAEELRDLYRRAWCYVQASVHEGFGIAVAEAMACGAVPVVTDRFSLPEVTGGLVEYIPLDDPQATAAAVLHAGAALPQQRQALRAWIVANFALERRERDLLAVLLDLKPGRRSRF